MQDFDLNKYSFICDDYLSKIVSLINEEWLSEHLISNYLSVNKESDYTINLIVNLNFDDDEYILNVTTNHITITGKNNRSFLYGLRDLAHLVKSKKIKNKEYHFICDVKERRLHLDMGRKFFTKPFIIRYIKLLSHLKINCLQLHFSENLGFRIESEYDPKIVSEEHLSKDDIREILQIANEYEIDIIPALDTPGHTDQILKVHPEYGQIDIDGNHYSKGIDITNNEVKDYIFGLYDEYLDLFKGCKTFHIGSDEYMDFQGEEFLQKYKPVLNEYAKKYLGDEYTWKDVFASYINELAEHIENQGFKVRIWNDGIYYSDDEADQKIQIKPSIGIDFWSQMCWNPHIATLETLMKNNLSNLYNVNADMFYYVLKFEASSESNPSLHSFYFKDQEQKIYNEWTLGLFEHNLIDNDDPRIKGACMAIWCDNPNICDENTIYEEMFNPLVVFAAKTINYNINNEIAYEVFKKEVIDVLKK